MLPQLSDPAIISNFMPPDDRESTSVLCYELGGIGLSDPSAGLQYQVWTLELISTDGGLTGSAVISSATQAPLVLFTLPALTEVDLTFDQNMKPFVAYVSQGNAGFWWYDATLPGTRFTALPAGSITPKCSLDDKRAQEIAAGRTDIIIAYFNNNNLYYRAQRDRYTVEYVLSTDIVTQMANPRLNKIGMDETYRLEFYVQGALYL